VCYSTTGSRREKFDKGAAARGAAPLRVGDRMEGRAGSPQCCQAARRTTTRWRIGGENKVAVVIMGIRAWRVGAAK